jgi:hypothetical protein
MPNNYVKIVGLLLTIMHREQYKLVKNINHAIHSMQKAIKIKEDTKVVSFICVVHAYTFCRPTFTYKR